MSYDYTRLRERILSTYGTAGAFAGVMGLSTHSMSKKLNGKTPWKQDEILRACGLLNIRETEISAYFFTIVVQ